VPLVSQPVALVIFYLANDGKLPLNFDIGHVLTMIVEAVHNMYEWYVVVTFVQIVL